MDNQPPKKHVKEPSQQAVTAWIAEQLSATGEEMHSQILRAFRTIGRTQARALCKKALQMKSEAGQDQPAGDLFLQLVRTEGVPKRQPMGQVSALVKSIAEQLQETEAEPIRLITRIVHLLGEEQAQHFLQDTLHIEEEGGLMLPNRSRRRTPGGVFFFLVRSSVSNKIRRKLFSVEGFPHLDTEAKNISVFASSITTKALQQTLRQTQKVSG